MLAVSLLGWSLVAGLALVLVLRSRAIIVHPDGSEEIVEHEGAGHALVRWGGIVGLTALSFYGAATVVALGGGKVGGTGSATPGAPVVSGLAAIVVDTSTTRGTYVVTAAGGSAHDSSRLVITRLASADTLIDSIYGGAVLDKTVSSNANLKADTTYRMFVQARATNGAGWGASVVDTFVNTASTWPNNEPASMTLIASTDGSDKYFGTGGSSSGWFFGGRWTDATPHVGENISCSGSRYGTCVTKRLDVGDLAGYNGLAEYVWTSTIGTQRHLYARFIFKFSNNYQLCSANEKAYGWVGGPGGDGADVYISTNGSTGAWSLVNEFTGAGFNNISLDFTQSSGSWITVELYFIAESSSGASDGSYTVWINGTQKVTASSQNWSSGTPGFSQMDLFNFWGGSSCTKTVQDTIFVSEVYLSGKN